MMEATLSFKEDELRLVKYALLNCDGISVPVSLVEAVEFELEKLEGIDMSDWNDCGDACKL